VPPSRRQCTPLDACNQGRVGRTLAAIPWSQIWGGTARLRRPRSSVFLHAPGEAVAIGAELRTCSPLGAQSTAAPGVRFKLALTISVASQDPGHRLLFAAGSSPFRAAGWRASKCSSRATVRLRRETASRPALVSRHWLVGRPGPSKLGSCSTRPSSQGLRSVDDDMDLDRDLQGVRITSAAVASFPDARAG